MKFRGKQLTKCVIVVLAVIHFVGCQPKESDSAATIQIGMILSLSGPGSSWGQVSLRSAQAIADYYNEVGGYEIDGVR